MPRKIMPVPSDTSCKSYYTWMSSLLSADIDDVCAEYKNCADFAAVLCAPHYANIMAGILKLHPVAYSNKNLLNSATC